MRAAVLCLTVSVAAAMPVTADATPDGAAIFKSNCAVCHGPDGKGRTPVGKSLKVRDLTSDEVQKQADKELAAITANGKGKMPAFKSKLTEAEINAVVGALRDMAKKQQR